AVSIGIDGVAQDQLVSHYSGSGPNPVGALEALISRAITWKLGIPCAHAPAFVGGLGQSDEVIDPRAAAEVASGSGLPCVLHGLAQAPATLESGGIGVADLAAVVVPFNCAGGVPAMAALSYDVPVVAVKSNTCDVGVAADQLGIPGIVTVENYAEAVAFVAC